MISADLCCLKIMGAGGWKSFLSATSSEFLKSGNQVEGILLQTATLILLHSEAPCCRFCTAAFRVRGNYLPVIGCAVCHIWCGISSIIYCYCGGSGAGITSIRSWSVIIGWCSGFRGSIIWFGTRVYIQTEKEDHQNEHKYKFSMKNIFQWKRNEAAQQSKCC